MSTLLLQTLLYAPGPFFCYPWKPVVNAVAGDSYSHAYAHFRRDHNTGTNLVLHAICLVFQLTCNFALLVGIDSALDTRSWTSYSLPVVATTTALLWGLALLPTPAPGVVTLASLASLGAAYGAACAGLASTPARIGLEGLWDGSGMDWSGVEWTAGEVVEAGVLAVFAAVLVVAIRTPKALLFGLGLVGWVLVWDAVGKSGVGGLGKDFEREILAGLAAAMCVLAATPKVPEAPVIGGMLLARLAYVATGNVLALLVGCAYTAPFLQGIAHRLTGETATLINLNNDGTQEDVATKVRFEWAHVTFFPSLALQSIHQSLFGGGSSPKTKHS